MAYDPNKKERASDNPYDAVVGGGRAEARGDGPPQAASAQALEGGNAGPTASGHVNFDQIFNANLGTSKREAGKIQQGAERKGQAVQGGVTGLQGQFDAATRTGAATPNQAQQNWAWQPNTGVVKPKLISGTSRGDTGTAGATDTDTTSTITERQPGLQPGESMGMGADGKYHRVSYDPNTGERREGPEVSEDQFLDWQDMLDGKRDRPAGPAQNPGVGGLTGPGGQGHLGLGATPEEFQKGIEEGAAQKYGGPGSLSDLDGYDQLLADAAGIQDEAQTLGMGNAGLQARGMNQLDAALVGGAGRKGFEDISQKYGGLKSELQKANEASIPVADAARKQATDAAAAYQALLNERGDFDKRVAADEADVKRINKSNDEAMEGLNDPAQSGSAFPQELDSPEEFGQLYRDFGLSGDDNGRMSDEDYEIFQAIGPLTDEDRAALARMTADERRAWFEQRRKERKV